MTINTLGAIQAGLLKKTPFCLDNEKSKLEVRGGLSVNTSECLI